MRITTNRAVPLWRPLLATEAKIHKPGSRPRICTENAPPVIPELRRRRRKPREFLRWRLRRSNENIHFLFNLKICFSFFSPQITWRDLQHLTVLTSTRNSLFDGRCREMPDLGITDDNTQHVVSGADKCMHYEWQMNGVGLEYNHLFGFGVLDAAEMVMLARVWKTVPPRYHCEAGSIVEPKYDYFSNNIQI